MADQSSVQTKEQWHTGIDALGDLTHQQAKQSLIIDPTGPTYT